MKKAAKSARAAGRRRVATKTSDKSHVNLRVGSKAGESIQIVCGRELQRAAMKWTYIARNRQRWRDSDSSAALAKRAQKQLSELGVNSAFLDQIAQYRLVEVSVPYSAEHNAWEARIFPWEYVISAAVSAQRSGAELTVVRHLDCSNSRPVRARNDGEVTSGWVVTSAPGELEEMFDFDFERDLPGHKLGIPFAHAKDPPLKDLAKQTDSRDIVHITGIDNHQAEDWVDLDSRATKWDGMVLATENGQLKCVRAERLAAAVGRHAPALVIYNLYHSAARICPLTVATGAEVAIGFQDTIDDTAAELFLADFYSVWRSVSAASLSVHDIHLAFITALRLVREYRRKLEGSCIVLWSARSVFHSQSAEMLCRESRRLAKKAQSDRETPVTPSTDRTGTGALIARVFHKDVLNFAALHNGRPLFDQFSLLKYDEGQFQDVHVEVELHTGAQSYPYRATLTARDHVTNLAESVRIPLTWMRDGGYDESVLSSLAVRVHWGSQPVLIDTFPVKLLPADDWEDTDEDRQWLPSFVYPRDPAIRKILQTAQPFLWCLTDEAGKGFDGYQSSVSRVDLQVRAIWCALAQELELQYINPPPSYQSLSQRLRSPSDILAEGRGTCIDLALLLAACCEYIDVYPVIVILNDHAFPGYWRSDAAHESFIEITDRELEKVSSAAGNDVEHSAGQGQQHAWVLEGQAGWQSVSTHVKDGKLVLLESTDIASRTAFADAKRRGVENLDDPKKFHSLVDVVLARRHGVTPLPIRGART